jgi:transcriptional regulator with XRE-family HTH domain
MQVRDHRKLARLALIQDASHRQIAEALGWKSHTYVGRILRGEVRTMEPEAAVRMCHYFGVAVDDFFLTKSSKIPGRAVRSDAA